MLALILTLIEVRSHQHKVEAEVTSLKQVTK